MSEWLGAAGVCLGTGALATALYAVTVMQKSRQRADTLQAGVDALRRDLEALASLSVRTGRRVQRVEHEYSDVAERVDVVESRAPASAVSGSLDQAIEWARRGADSEKLSAQFGLSSGEAELVARLHGRKTGG